jgi:hypothetical protein
MNPNHPRLALQNLGIARMAAKNAIARSSPPQFPSASSPPRFHDRWNPFHIVKNVDAALRQ